MRVPRLLLHACSAALVLGALTTAPASAADVPFTVSTVDTATPGHATGTVTTEAAYVRTQLWSAGMGFTRSGTFTSVPGDTHQVAFDFQTWGLEDGAFVTVRACSGTSDSTCGPETRHVFTPSDVAPEVTWSAVDKVSPNNPPYVVTVSDPQGEGSSLRAVFLGVGEAVNRNGDTTLKFPAGGGTGTIEILRCGLPGYCVSTGLVSPEITVRQSLYVGVNLPLSGAIRPGDDEAPDLTMSVYTQDAGDYTLDWWVSTQSGSRLPGVGASGLPVTMESLTAYELPLDLTGLTSGTRYVRASLSRDVDGFGVLSGTSQLESGEVRIDVTPPSGAVSVSAHSLFPRRDGYRDSVTVALGVTGEYVDAKLEVLDSDGSSVRTFHEEQSLGEFIWNGKVVGGYYAREGDYTFRATLTDYLGNAAVYEGGRVTVSSKKLVTRTFRETVSATGSLENKHVGRCSVLKRPSARGWAGSMGLYTNTRCNGNFAKSVVSTTHAIKVPKAFRYGSFNISTYGGAATSRRGSYLFFDQLNKKLEWGDDDKRLGYKVGAHAGPDHKAARYLVDDRFFVWGVYTYLGAAYDVKSFTVTLSYEVLV